MDVSGGYIVPAPPTPTAVRITSVIEGAEGFMVAFRHVSGRGVSGAITFPAREPWMEKGAEVALAMGEAPVRVLEVLAGRSDVDDLPTGTIRGSDLIADPEP